MLYLLGGFAILGGLLLLGYLFVNADPARLARSLKWTGIVIAVVAVVALLRSPDALAVLLMPLAMLMPLLRRVRSMLGGYRPPAGGQSSTVATAFLRMTLDHDTGTMERHGPARPVRRHAAGRSCAPPICWRCCANAGPKTRRARACSKPISTASAPIGATRSAGERTGGSSGGRRGRRAAT